MFLDPIQKRALSRSVHLEAVYLEALLYCSIVTQFFVDLNYVQTLFSFIKGEALISYLMNFRDPFRYVCFLDRGRSCTQLFLLTIN